MSKENERIIREVEEIAARSKYIPFDEAVKRFKL